MLLATKMGNGGSPVLFHLRDSVAGNGGVTTEFEYCDVLFDKIEKNY